MLKTYNPALAADCRRIAEELWASAKPPAPLLRVDAFDFDGVADGRVFAFFAFVGLFLWSAGVQALGAYAYDVTGWNGRYVYDVVLPGTNNKATYDDSAQAQRRAGEQGGRVEARALNVDVPAYRYRLWSVGDNPILYYLLNFSEARKRRHLTVEKFLGAEG